MPYNCWNLWSHPFDQAGSVWSLYIGIMWKSLLALTRRTSPVIGALVSNCFIQVYKASSRLCRFLSRRRLGIEVHVHEVNNLSWGVSRCLNRSEDHLETCGWEISISRVFLAQNIVSNWVGILPVKALAVWKYLRTFRRWSSENCAYRLEEDISDWWWTWGVCSRKRGM